MSIQFALQHLRECSTDARATFPRYRQRQIIALYNVLSNHKTDFIKALQQDTGKPEFEADLEISLVLQQLRLQFEDTHFEGLTERVAKHKTGGKLFTPYGNALIVGHKTAPLESTISPLSGAIAAGNVVLTLLPKEAKATQELISLHVYPTLDRDAYPILLCDDSTFQAALSHSFDVYLATSIDLDLRKQVAHAAAEVNAPFHLLPTNAKTSAQNICIVSKTTPSSELPRIARLVARAKFCALGGQGLGALSFICVHEELHDEFIHQLVQVTRELPSAGSDLVLGNAQISLNDLGSGKVVCGSLGQARKGVSAPVVIEKVAGDSKILDQKIKGCVLPVVCFASTEEAISIASKRLGHNLHVFANQLELDYFATELRPPVMTANDISLDSLVGIYPPQAPASKSGRWTSTMFERAIYVHAPALTDSSSIFPPYSAGKFTLMQKMFLPNFQQQLRIKLKPHANIIRRVFFLQGLFLSLALVLSTILSVTGFSGYHVYRFFRRA